MNAAISASVVLASRLANDLAVFALILFSVQAFALFPRLRRRLGVRVPCREFFCRSNDGSCVPPPCNWHLRSSSLPFRSWSRCRSRALLPGYIPPCSWASRSLHLRCWFGPKSLRSPSLSLSLTGTDVNTSEIRGPWDVAVPKVN